MKKALSISFVFIGLVIGAGFASGKEIFRYFCIPSQTDMTGTVLATIGFGLMCYIIMQLSQECNTPNLKSFITEVAGNFSKVAELFMSLFMFCGFFIMLAACGVLFEENFHLPPVCGILFLAVVCFVVFAFDVQGLVAFNAILVPLMIAGMLYICFASIHSAIPTFSFFEKLETNPLVSSLCYVSYNTVTAAAVLVPLSRSSTKKQIISASAVSSAVLGFLIYLSWLCMNLQFDSLVHSEMPLLVLATQKGAVSSYVYTSVLFMALCTTAVSHGFGLLSKLSFSKKSYRICAAALLCLLGIPFAGLGFSKLVTNLYAAFGYAGFIWTGAVIWKYLSKKTAVYDVCSKGQ